MVRIPYFGNDMSTDEKHSDTFIKENVLLST